MTTKLTARAATLDDALYLASRLRQEDLSEIQANSGQTPEASIRAGLTAGEAWVAEDDEGPVAIFGLIPSPPPLGGVPWMLATPRFLDHQRQFLRECRQWIETMLARFPILTNVVDARNALHVRWLLWCGFQVVNKLPEFGAGKLPFIHMMKVADHV
ncbi:MAG: hypothetical protein F8N15_04900 [Methanobacterium sp.]|nr:hypothetical protein [Methanobacterium sp.]